LDLLCGLTFPKGYLTIVALGKNPQYHNNGIFITIPRQRIASPWSRATKGRGEKLKLGKLKAEIVRRLQLADALNVGLPDPVGK